MPDKLLNPEKYIHPDTRATDTCVSKNTRLIKEIPMKAHNKLLIGSCSNHTMSSSAKGKLPLPSLPEEAATAHKFNDMNINLLSISKTCDNGCVGVFCENDMFISKKEDLDIKLKNNS